jgi:hypothetical protein
MDVQSMLNLMPSLTNLGNVWRTLTAVQQKTVQQTVVRVCQSLIVSREQEELHESTGNTVNEPLQ